MWLVHRGDRDSAAFFAGASSGNDSDGDWQTAAGGATAVADRVDRAAVAGQVGVVSMMSMDEEEQSAEAKQCLKALKEGKRCHMDCDPAPNRYPSNEWDTMLQAWERLRRNDQRLHGRRFIFNAAWAALFSSGGVL